MVSSVVTPGPKDDGGGGAPAGAITYRGQVLDPLMWRFTGATSKEDAASSEPSARNVLERARDACLPVGLRHLVVGVVGPRAASVSQRELARALGQILGGLSLTTICGGRGGVMEAVCQGVNEAGGLSIGILPGYGPEGANPFVGIPLPTGLSEGRNMVIARAARVLIAVGGSYGTLTEMAYGLHFGKVVIALDDAPAIDGLVRAADAEAAIELCCKALLDQAEGLSGPNTDSPNMS